MYKLSPVLDLITRRPLAPCQHSTARYPWDRDKSLWSSWVIQDRSSAENTNPASVSKSFHLGPEHF